MLMKDYGRMNIKCLLKEHLFNSQFNGVECKKE